MIICNHCGAENPDGATFCSLCLVRFTPSVQDSRPVSSEGYYLAPVQNQAEICPDTTGHASFAQDPTLCGTDAQIKGEYMSPGDYRALVDSKVSAFPGSDYKSRDYGSSAMVRSHQVEDLKSGLFVTLLLSLLYSFVVLCVVFLSGFVVGPLIFIIAGGVSRASLESGITLAYFLVVIYQMAILFFAGYFASRSAREKGKGWLYGALCVALFIFFWEPLVNFFFSGSIITDTYSLRGMFVALVLMLPVGAFGGWVAERRYMK